MPMVLLLIICACWMYPGIVQGQSRQEAYRAATKALNADALAAEPNNTAALYNLGCLYLEERNPDSAAVALDRALEQAPENPDYLAARAEVYMVHPDHLLIHDTRAGARPLLQQALAIYPGHLPAGYNLAICLLHSRVEWQDIAGARELFRQVAATNPAYKQVLYYQALAETLHDPKTDPVPLFENVIKRKPNQGEAMIRLAEAIFQTDDAPPERLEQASALYHTGLLRLRDTFEIARLSREFALLLDQTEKAEFDSLAVNDRGYWMARYWRRLDPTPGTLLNERVQEHVRRVHFARQHFLSEHGEYGFDERGNIYVRYGEPDERHLGAGLGYQGGRAGEFQTVIGNLGYIENESWIYFSIDRNLYFDFVERNGYYLAHSLEDALPAGGKSDLALIQDIYRSREALGGIYRQVANATSEIEAMSRIETGDVDRDEVIKQTPAVSHFNFGGDRPLPFIIQTGAFRSANDMTRLEVYYGIPLKELEFKAGKKDIDAEPVELRVSFLDQAYNPVESFPSNLSIPRPATDERDDLFYVNQTGYDLTPGEYFLSISVRAPGSRRWGVSKDTLRVPHFGERAKLTLSTIQMSPDLTWPAQVAVNAYKGGYVARPHPAMTFPKNMPAQVFYEIYNLTLGSNGQTDYTVTLTVEPLKGSGVVSAVAGVFTREDGEQPRISLTESGAGSVRTEHRATTLDLNKIEQGDMRLIIAVTDNIIGATAMQTQRFYVDKPAEEPKQAGE